MVLFALSQIAEFFRGLFSRAENIAK